MTVFAMFYDLKVTYGNSGFYYHEDFYKATYSPNVMQISTRLHTVPTHAPDWATIVAHVPWISQYTIAKNVPFIVQYHKNYNKINIDHSPS